MNVRLPKALSRSPSRPPAPGACPRLQTSHGDVAFVVVGLAAITVLGVVTDSARNGLALQMLLRELYYIPILYAAVRFGWRGGLATSVAAAFLYAHHAWFSPFLGGLLGPGGSNIYEIVMYLVIGTLFGWFKDINEARTVELKRIGAKLEDAYSTLEQRTMQLANVQEYTQSILRCITSGVLTVGPDGSVATANSAAEQLLGMSEDEMVPHKISALFDDDGGISVQLDRVLQGRVPRVACEVQGVTKAGRTVRLVMSIARMRDVSGKVLGAVVAFDDVSEVRALAEHVIWADRLASMGELAAGVAHEVRNPLGIIKASVQLVEESRNDPARTSEATAVIKQEIDRLDRVIKALLDFGRPSSPAFRPLDIRDVIGEVVLFTRQFAAQSGVEIRVVEDNDVPFVYADADQMKQVFVNLIANAVQAMEHSGGTVTIRVWSDGDMVFFSVADDGAGIDSAEIERVFAPFYSTHPDGTGLGLTIVRRIIDQHRGVLSVESTPGAGTTFTVALLAVAPSEGAS